MSSPLKKQPEAVADKVLKRVEVSKIARRLQGRLTLAHFKTKHGWEDLTLDTIEPKYDEELRRKHLYEGEALSDSSSTTSELPYPTSRGAAALMSSPMKAPLFSDAIGPSSTGHRKRTYMASFDMTMSSPAKRFRSSPTAHKSFNASPRDTWKVQRQFTQPSPSKPRRQKHFTTSAGPNVSLFQGTRRVSIDLASPNFAAPSEDEDDLLPTTSFQVTQSRDSPPRTPPMRPRSLDDQDKENMANGNKPDNEGADLLLYLATSPSPAMPSIKTRMEPPSTPPQRKTDLALPSSMMTTPGGGNLFPTTPGQNFDFSDFVNITPSPAQKPWKTPVALSSAKTPLSVARRRLTFDEPLHGLT